MRIQGPERYLLTLSPERISVRSANGVAKFSGVAMLKQPKLYVVSVAGRPVYVGVTKQPIRNRLRLVRNATGERSFYGHAVRHDASSAMVDVWCHTDAIDRNERDIETVEAELVFLIRRAGQWPKYQTEIPFHQSTWTHRSAAADIMAHYIH